LNKGHDVAVDWWSLGILIFEMLAGYPPFSEDLSSKQTVFEQILNQRVDIPDYFHPHARDIVQKLLVPDPSARVGFVKGMRDIKNHEWFYGIEWDKLYERRDCGPLNPEVVRDGDTHNFYKFSDVELQGELEDPSLNYEQIFLDF
jgi:protein kinase A